MKPYYETDNGVLYHGDCLEIMPRLEPVDLVLTDLPYGTTQNKWDSIIPFGLLWAEYDRLSLGAMLFTASQPFTAKLINSNINNFKHEWIWVKNRGSNFANTVREPFKEHESILVFSNRKWIYNKQMQKRTGGGSNRVKYNFNKRSESSNYRKFTGVNKTQGDLRVPSSVQKFNTEVGLHPTQKPRALMEYFINTYSDGGGSVLDNCIGSGTTATACERLGRKWIGIEISEKYCEIAAQRIENEYRQRKLF